VSQIFGQPSEIKRRTVVLRPDFGRRTLRLPLILPLFCYSPSTPPTTPTTRSFAQKRRSR